jgi:hypothetical protein
MEFVLNPVKKNHRISLKWKLVSGIQKREFFAGQISCFTKFGINSKTAKNILGEKWNFVPKFTITVWYF